MKNKNWTKTNHLIVRHRFGVTISEHFSWKDVVANYYRDNFTEHSLYTEKDWSLESLFSIAEMKEYVLRRAGWGDGKYNLIDEHGMIVPDWKLDEIFNQFPDRRELRRRRWHRNYGVHTFRRGPVQGIRNWKASGRGQHRNIHTYPEHRDNAGLTTDEDAQEYNIRPRGKRRGHNLPDQWDDLNFSDWKAKSWKNYRKFQWKLKK